MIFISFFSACISEEVIEVQEGVRPLLTNGEIIVFRSNNNIDTVKVTVYREVVSKDKTYNYELFYLRFIKIQSGKVPDLSFCAFTQTYNVLAVNQNGVGGKLTDEYKAVLQSEELSVKVFTLTNPSFQPRDPVTLHYNERYGIIKYILENGEEFERVF